MVVLKKKPLTLAGISIFQVATIAVNTHPLPIKKAPCLGDGTIWALPSHSRIGVALRCGWTDLEESMDPDALAKVFVDHYYYTFDTNRADLINLYQDASMLTFEGAKVQGSSNIVGKLTGLPFQQCKHTISTVDCQPSGPAGGMIVFVSGMLQLAGEEHQLRFSQLFHLMPTAQGSFFVLNDIFRLNYG